MKSKKNEVEKTSNWIQRKLVLQFQNINNSDDYVNLLLKSDIQFTNEIAFTISHSPLGNLSPVEFIKEKSQIIYQIETFI